MKPILFNADMVEAILDGRKTATRRVAFEGSNLRPFPRENCPDGWWFRGRVYRNWDDTMRSPQGVMSLCRYRPGDTLYVRETFAEMESGYLYKADFSEEGPDYGMRWCPSIHMPKEAARLFLRVTDVRVERLQDMTIYGLQSEGFLGDGYISQYAAVSEDHFDGFKALWDRTIKKSDLGKYGWAANPWVWVIEFERISKEEARGNA